MGLDMYLYAKKHVSAYEFSSAEDKAAYAGILKIAGLKPADVDKSTPSGEISLTVMYWRKANAIHRWFVQNVMDGGDNCREHWVGREELQELLEVCEKVLAASKLVDAQIANGYSFDAKGNMVPILEAGQKIEDPSVAEELLPTQEGFFFGSTDYDQWYHNDVERTAKGLKALLANAALADWDFEYRASW